VREKDKNKNTGMEEVEGKALAIVAVEELDRDIEEKNFLLRGKNKIK
jgi:hypothetical protein